MDKANSTSTALRDDASIDIHRKEIEAALHFIASQAWAIKEVAGEIEGGSQRPEVLAAAIASMAIHLGALSDDLCRRVFGAPGVVGSVDAWMNQVAPWRKESHALRNGTSSTLKRPSGEPRPGG